MTSFKNIGKSTQEVNQLKKNVERSLDKKMMPIGIKMPLEKGVRSYESLFKMNTSLQDQVSNNFKTFLLTKKGELLGKPDFGTNISGIYNRSDLEINQIEDIVMNDISTNTSKFFPFITLLDFESREISNNNELDANYVKIAIRYNIQGFEDKINSIELTIRRSI